jgi:hypothetical protein
VTVDHNLSADQIAAAMSGPAIAVNHYITIPHPAGLRLAFLEQYIGQPSALRAAVLIPPSDVGLLIELLQSYQQARATIPTQESQTPHV